MTNKRIKFWSIGILTLAALAFFMPLASAHAACSGPAGVAGEMVYNDSAKTFQYCNDTNWVAMNKPGSGAGGCAAPVLAEGHVVYNSNSRQLQGCAGNVHRGFGPANGGSESEWLMVSAGYDYNCGIRVGGMLMCWGNNQFGKLGNGNTTQQNHPAQVSGGGTWKYVTTGVYHTCGIKTDDTAWCWGWNLDGELGDGSTTQRTTPVAVSGGGTWKSIGAGGFATCGIKSDDTAWCWGRGGNGQLGDGSTTAKQTSPIAVSGGSTWKYVSSGDNTQACGIKSDGTAWCWGGAAQGQRGDGTNTGTQTTPVSISGGGVWKDMSVGGVHTCAIKSDDSIWCWGRDQEGQLGNNSTTDSNIPVAVSGGGAWKSIHSSGQSNCAIKSDNTLWCWGANEYGQLGTNTTGVAQTTPATVAGGGTWLMVAVGGTHSCGTKSNNMFYCWGSNLYGQLNADVPLQQNVPETVSGGGAWKSVSAGGTGVGYNSCGIKIDNTGWCWGSGTNGQIGNANTGNKNIPTAISGGANWKGLDSGGQFSCGIKSDDTAWCWGANDYGQVGNNGFSWVYDTPQTLTGGGTWKSLSSGGGHSCAIKSDDTAWCWGKNDQGQIGDNTTWAFGRKVPTAVNGGGAWKKISAGGMHSCGIKSDDTLWCWGDNFSGKLGDGTSTQRLVPTAISGGGAWKAVSAGGNHTCAIKSDDTLWCWGNNFYGNVGDNTTTTPRLTATAVYGGGAWKSVTAGAGFTCGIRSDDTLWCWGSNATAQLGDGTTTARSAPVQITADLWKNVNTDSGHTCGIKSDDTLWCWGDGRYGQLGDGVSGFSTDFVVTWCGSPTGRAGSLKYNSSTNKMQYCDGVGWVETGVSTTVPDPCAGSPSPGDACADGTVYAGLSPDGNVPMYTTRCDGGQTWDGVACVGVRTQTTWNNGNFGGQTLTGANSATDGDGNTVTLLVADSDSSTGGTQPHLAAKACGDLNVSGHTDWYLPAVNELELMRTNKNAIGNFIGSGLWSSTEFNSGTANYRDFSNLLPANGFKDDPFKYYRCVRK